MASKHRVALIMLAVGVVGCAARGAAPPATASTIHAEVYAALVAHAFPSGRPDTILLEEKTVTYREIPEGNSLRRGKDVVPIPLPSRLTSLSAEPLPVRPEDFPAPVRLLPPTRARQLAAERLGGTMVLAVTPIVFSNDSSQALVYYDGHCGALCGAGYELWLVRSADGRWLLRQDMSHWRS